MSTRRHRRKAQSFNARRRESNRLYALRPAMRPRRITIVLSSHDEWDRSDPVEYCGTVLVPAQTGNSDFVIGVASQEPPS